MEFDCIGRIHCVLHQLVRIPLHALHGHWCLVGLCQGLTGRVPSVKVELPFVVQKPMLQGCLKEWIRWLALVQLHQAVLQGQCKGVHQGGSEWPPFLGLHLARLLGHFCMPCLGLGAQRMDHGLRLHLHVEDEGVLSSHQVLIHVQAQQKSGHLLHHLLEIDVQSLSVSLGLC